MRAGLCDDGARGRVAQHRRARADHRAFADADRADHDHVRVDDDIILDYGIFLLLERPIVTDW